MQNRSTENHQEEKERDGGFRVKPAEICYQAGEMRYNLILVKLSVHYCSDVVVVAAEDRRMSCTKVLNEQMIVAVRTIS